MIAVIAALICGPLINGVHCAIASSCSMGSCCEQGKCSPEKSCASSSVSFLDQVEVSQSAHSFTRLPATVVNFRLLYVPKVAADNSYYSRFPESPPRLTSCPPQAVTCVWLI